MDTTPPIKNTIVLIDADGVTIQKSSLFSEKYSQEYGVPIEDIIPFFKNEFRRCQLGEADMKTVLVPYLAKWGWNKSVEDFLLYWFESNTKADEEVLRKIEELRKKGYVFCLVTDQEKYRAEYIQETLGFKHLFTNLFFSYSWGLSKSSPEFFKKILWAINRDPQHFVCFDDEEENIEAAREAGIESTLYTSIKDLESIALKS